MSSGSKHPEGYMKKYQEENKERLAAYRKEYYEANKEEITLKNKLYQAENKEAILAQRKAKYEKNRPEDIDFKICWSLKNLQPLEASKNMSKRDKIERPFQPALAIAV